MTSIFEGQTLKTRPFLSKTNQNKRHLGSRYIEYINIKTYIYISLRIQVCPKERITPQILLISDGIGTQNILLDRKGFGFLGTFWSHANV